MKTIAFSTQEIQTLVIALIYTNGEVSADIDQTVIDRLTDKLTDLNMECAPENGYTVVAHAAGNLF